MKINIIGNERSFNINDKKINVYFSDDGSIEIFNEEDPTHTGEYFENAQDFIYYINALTEIAKKIKGDI